MPDLVDPRSPIVTVVGDLSFCPALAPALVSSGCAIRRSLTLGDAMAATRGSLVVMDGDDQLRSDLAGVRALHGHATTTRSPVLLLFRGHGVPDATLAYGDGPLDTAGPDVPPDALALRLRALAGLAAAGSSESRSASLLTAVIEAPDGMALVSPGGAVEFANRALLGMLGSSDEESAGVVLRNLRAAVDETRPFVDLVPSDGAPWHGELQAAADPPLDLILAATARRVVDPRGAEAVLVILRDVTRERLLEQGLADSQRMDAVGQLAGGVAHDFNNILSVITTLSDLLMRLRPEDDPDREDLQEIFDSAQKGSEIARQLSAFSRPGEGESEVLDLNAVVESNVKMLRRLLGEGVDLSFASDPDTGTVRADPVHLNQLILNLALNARDAMPNGGAVGISTGRRTLISPLPTASGVVAPGPYAVLKVTDSGQGMDESTRQRLFEPFFTTRGWGRHSGLGLSVVYGVVQGAGGGIEVESALGVGTTLRILIPALESLDDSGASESSRDRPADTRLPSAAGETILLVEDHEVVREGLGRALEAAGYKVVLASDGSGAVGLLRTGSVRPHLVLSDVVMPLLNGTGLEQQVRELGLSVPMVFMSGYPEHPEVDRLRRAGVQVLPKPLDLGRLNRVLRLRLDEAAAI